MNNQDKWNYCQYFPLFTLLGVTHCLTLFHMYTNFVYFHNAEERITEIAIGYMVNPTIHVNKVFK